MDKILFLVSLALTVLFFISATLPLVAGWAREQRAIASLDMERTGSLYMPPRRRAIADCKATLKQRALERKWSKRIKPAQLAA